MLEGRRAPTLEVTVPGDDEAVLGEDVTVPGEEAAVPTEEEVATLSLVVGGDDTHLEYKREESRIEEGRAIWPLREKSIKSTSRSYTVKTSKVGL